MKMDEKSIIETSGAAVTGHFVYKARYMHGPGYIDKEIFPEIGALYLIRAIYEVADNAIKKGFVINDAPVGIVCPAYGAIPYGLTLAEAFEKRNQGVKFFPARTELMWQTDGEKKVHYIPEKLASRYHGKAFIIFEDIVNNGTTIREVEELFQREVDAKILAAISFVNRGGQTAKSLGVPAFYPLLDIVMAQYDLRAGLCPLCDEGVPINTDLGKGAEWVEMFGQPPYASGTDFSKFWM
jgi:orotate phosphoribosyltransferase